MDADDSYGNLSEKDMIYETVLGRYPVSNDRELEAGYAAYKKRTEFINAPIRPLLRGQFDRAIPLGYKEDSSRNLSEKDIVYETVLGRYPVSNDRELEAGYAAYKKCMEFITRGKFCLQVDWAIRLGRKEEAVRTAVEASTHYEALGKMSGSRFLHNSGNNNKEKKKTKKKAFVPASSTHSKESQKEQRSCLHMIDT